MGADTSGGPYGVALLCLVLLALHSAAIGIPFMFHYYDNLVRGNEQRPSVKGYLRAYVVEWFYGFAVHVSYLPGLLGGAVSDRFDPKGGPPIVLCHGFYMTRSCFFALYWRLRRAGYRNINAVNLRPFISPLEQQAERLARMVRVASTAAGGQPVIGIGHSQGGILFRRVAESDPAPPLAQIVTIGSPHRGTRMAYLGLGVNARQLRPGSLFLTSLAEESAVPLTAIYSDLDQIVFPTDTAKLGPDSHFMAETGHFTLLYSQDVARRVLKVLPPPSPLNEPHSSHTDVRPAGATD